MLGRSIGLASVMAKSAVQPYRDGVDSSRCRPAEKVAAATTPASPTTAPTAVARTGTAERPRPGLTAKVVPASSQGRPSRAASAAGSTDIRADEVESARGAGQVVTAATPTVGAPGGGHASAEE